MASSSRIIGGYSQVLWCRGARTPQVGDWGGTAERIVQRSCPADKVIAATECKHSSLEARRRFQLANADAAAEIGGRSGGSATQ